jgi:death-on-curing protein
MQWYGEIRYGVAFRELVESALARPQQAAAYENADLIRQAATLCFGLVKNHPWVGGNKRTATYITEAFLLANDWQLKASVAETLELVLAIESDLYKVDEIEAWFRLHTVQEEFDSE